MRVACTIGWYITTWKTSNLIINFYTKKEKKKISSSKFSNKGELGYVDTSVNCEITKFKSISSDYLKSKEIQIIYIYIYKGNRLKYLNIE